MVTALFPGSFDPLTNGHLDLITRSADLFDSLTIGLGVNPKKNGWLPVETRVELLEQSLREARLEHVPVITYTGLTTDAAREVGASVIVRGIRGGDWQSEYTQATANRHLGVETLLLPTDPKWSALSSSVIRELVAFGGPIEALVPGPVARALSGTSTPR